MLIIYSNDSCYVTSSGSLYTVVSPKGRVLITRDYNKAILCCDGII
jgi:hypothetical protein